MLSPKFGQPDTAHAPSPQPVISPHEFQGWFDEKQSENPIQIRETSAISPSLFTCNDETLTCKEILTAHFG